MLWRCRCASSTSRRGPQRLEGGRRPAHAAGHGREVAASVLEGRLRRAAGPAPSRCADDGGGRRRRTGCGTPAGDAAARRNAAEPQAGTRQTRHSGRPRRNSPRNVGQRDCPMRSGWLETVATLEGRQSNDGILEDARVTATRYPCSSRVRAHNEGFGARVHNG